MAAWNTLTDKEKELDRRISSIGQSNFQETQCFFDMSEKTIDDVMKKIGALPKERDFVIDRMKLYVRAGEALNRADKLIKTHSRLLDTFEKEDKKWAAKNKELGLDL
ncbi:MAG: hypothetical protein AB2L24_16540 [Mangrovibacterium sp.]